MTPLEQLEPLTGTILGVSDWMTVSQDRIDLFTKATDDPQWIHIDPERAAAGPFGATIAQGYLTMSLIVPLAGQVPLPLAEPPRMGVNYGLDRLRFPAPVRVNSRIRAVVSLLGVEEVAGGIQVRRNVTIEIEGEPKPAAVAETVTRLYI